MIVDKFSNLGFYKSVIKNLDNAIEAVKKLEKMEVGKYEFEGGFFMVQQGVTNPMNEGTFEVHRKYVDIHIIVDGSEDVAWGYLSDLKEETAYDEEKDAAFYSGNTDHNIHVTSGMCYVAFPHDGHMPVRHVSQSQSYTKIVIKLPAE
ncbi:MAG: YhcH/YjgK/YiaL family protein [Herbinix sp.]|nr:YhcH/YjgK/YiaL family protein [Herbinix sp.]